MSITEVEYRTSPTTFHENQPFKLEINNNNNNMNNINKIQLIPVNSSNSTIGSIYVYKNDPKVVNKGVNVSNFRHAQGGFLPLLADSNYKERKLDNLTYNYDAKLHHGMRPMHQTTFSLSQQGANNHNEFISQSKIDFQGFQLRPEYIPTPGSDQFKSQIDLTMNSNQRTFSTSYSKEFYNKNDDTEYINSFDVMPKYSVPKQKKQLERDNKIKVYNNRKTTVTEALVQNKNEPTYWSEYNRTHNYLGAKRGQGVSRDYPDRPSYNIFTGDVLSSPSWSMNGNYKKSSGNVVLNENRKTSTNIFN